MFPSKKIFFWGMSVDRFNLSRAAYQVAASSGVVF